MADKTKTRANLTRVFALVVIRPLDLEGLQTSEVVRTSGSPETSEVSPELTPAKPNCQGTSPDGWARVILACARASHLQWFDIPPRRFAAHREHRPLPPAACRRDNALPLPRSRARKDKEPSFFPASQSAPFRAAGRDHA